MIARIWRAYLAEVIKGVRLRQAWAGPVVMLVALGIAPFMRSILRDGRSDYDFIAYVTPATLNLLGFLMLLAGCASLVAPEIGGGSIRLFLVRPVRRGEYLMAKFLAGASYAVLLTAITAAGTWATAWALGELHGVAVGGELVHTGEAMAQSYAIGAALSLLPMLAGVACALLASVCARSSGTAVAVSVGLWLGMDMVKHPLGIDAYVFTTYLETPWQIFVNRCDGLDAAWWPMAGWCAAVSVGTAVPALVLAALVLHRRDFSG
jgi:ABC-type transport system involved in multi-copper enzyme maturation permease subunit